VHFTSFRQSIIRRLALGGLLVAAVALAMGPLVPARAAGTVVLSGRVYNGATGVGYAGVQLDFCGAGTALSGANGNWDLTVPSGAGYCVRVIAGAPAGLAGPAVRNNPEVAGHASYEYQQAGVNCYHNPGCDANLQQWDRPIDGGLDFVYTPAPPAAAPVAPAPPAATPASAPAATPAPAASSAAPTDFKAELTQDARPQVKLQWKPAAAPAAGNYHLERSLDRVTWAVLADKLTDPTYIDQDVSADVHYYYRLTALSAAGPATDPVLADIAIGKVLAADANADASYVSSDHLATVVVPNGAVPADAQCSVTSGSGRPLSTQRIVLAGPYELICRDASGGTIADFKHDVTWHLKLGDKMRGATPPQLVRADKSDQPGMAASTYDKTQREVTGTLSGLGRVAVLETPIDWGWINYVIIGGMALIAVFLLAVLPRRKKNRLEYQEYLRAKYYNL
jgi:hypothetical protein